MRFFSSTQAERARPFRLRADCRAKQLAPRRCRTRLDYYILLKTYLHRNIITLQSIVIGIYRVFYVLPSTRRRALARDCSQTPRGHGLARFFRFFFLFVVFRLLIIIIVLFSPKRVFHLVLSWYTRRTFQRLRLLRAIRVRCMDFKRTEKNRIWNRKLYILVKSSTETEPKTVIFPSTENREKNFKNVVF